MLGKRKRLRNRLTGARLGNFGGSGFPYSSVGQMTVTPAVAVPSVASAAIQLIAASDKTSATSWAATTAGALAAGRIGVVVLAKDNTGTTDAETSEVTSVTDSAGNTWQKAKEFCNGNGTAATGAVVSVWWTKAASTLAAGGTITFFFSAATAVKAATGWVFTINSGQTLSVAGGSTRADDAADPGSLTVGSLASAQYLWLRGTAIEDSMAVTPVSSATATFTEIPIAGSTGGVPDTNMKAWGEFIIATATTKTSDPTYGASADGASVLVAFSEIIG